MGLEMIYTAGEETFSFRMSPSEIEILEFLRKKNFNGEVEAIFGVADFGKIASIERKKLLENLDSLMNSIEENKEVLPYIYVTKEEIPRGSGMYSSGTGVISGFEIDGVPHSLEAGIEKCILTKLVQDNSGKWRDCEPKDVRDQKIIKVDKSNFSGDIEIKKRRKPTKLIRHLEQLRSFLLKSNVETIQKILG